MSLRELDARLVSLVGLRPAATQIRLAALNAGLAPRSWLGTETVARMLGLRVNHERVSETLERQVEQSATRAEAAYSIARVLALTEDDREAVREAVATFGVPYLTDWQRAVLARALRFVGSPYVWAGTSERKQTLGGRLLPGGFDCSGFVWRVYKLEPYAGAPSLTKVLRGRTTYEMSGEVARTARIARSALEPGDVVFFGDRGARSAPAEVGHMGIYVGNEWIVHSSRFGTTLTPMKDWYETRFAWGRRPLAEAGLAGTVRGLAANHLEPARSEELPVAVGRTRPESRPDVPAVDARRQPNVGATELPGRRDAERRITRPCREDLSSVAEQLHVVVGRLLHGRPCEQGGASSRAPAAGPSRVDAGLAGRDGAVGRETVASAWATRPLTAPFPAWS